METDFGVVGVRQRLIMVSLVYLGSSIVHARLVAIPVDPIGR